ncbi:MAG: ATP-dependent RNA helicase [Bacteroidetes bacterium HGW-Bacteroidetes-6]|nr:MAG: ATP-dependent RNA helicase [Bacteroidetes bacterium HGW-Bacteroidetes-6]
MTFHEFGFTQELLEGIDAIGYNNATPIQEQAIPAIMTGKDLIASAQTGTGKTAAFLLPITNRIITSVGSNNIKCMVIVPTRELAIQIDQQMQGFSYFTQVSSIPVYGGTAGPVFENERKSLSEGVDMVICTPGRMLSHLKMGYVKLSTLSFLVLDEADRLLDMGFYDDIIKIMTYLPKNCQKMLFSATMPAAIRQLARKALVNPIEINIATSKPAERVKQEAAVVYDNQKTPLIEYILKQKKLQSIMIFCSTKDKTKQLTRELKKLRLSVDEMHSDIDQSAREAVLNRFKARQLNILVATDILSRGIDIEDIDLIINYDVPHDAEDYIHRVGRTARAASEGEAITLIGEKDHRRFGIIEEFIGKTIDKMVIPEQFGDCPSYNPVRKSKSNNKKKWNLGKRNQGKNNNRPRHDNKPQPNRKTNG